MHFSSFAVLYRTNAQARIIEEVLSSSGIPCRVLRRPDIASHGILMMIISILRVIIDPSNKEAVLGTLPFKDDVSSVDDALSGLIEIRESIHVSELIQRIINDFKIKPRGDDESWALEGIMNLASSKVYPQGIEGIMRFHDEVMLANSEDSYDPSIQAVHLMTIHMAKGLEFRVVFIPGMEEGIMPFTINREDQDIEEERRLFYVGMTRAKDELVLLRARRRIVHGRRMSLPPSRFLEELPEGIETVEIPDKKKPKVEKQMGLF